MRVVVCLIGLSLTVLLAGCATTHVGRPFDPAVVETFVVGRTTRADVHAALGEPWLRSVQPDGAEVWTYLYSTGRATTVPLLVYTRIDMQSQTTSVTLTFRDDRLARLDWIERPGAPAAPPVSP